MSAGTYDLVITQGEPLEITIRIERAGFDFAAYAGRAKIRSGFGATATTIASLTVPAGTFSSGVATFVASLTAAQTASIVDTSGLNRVVKIGFWDFEIYASATLVERILEGTANLSREATTA